MQAAEEEIGSTGQEEEETKKRVGEEVGLFGRVWLTRVTCTGNCGERAIMKGLV